MRVKAAWCVLLLLTLLVTPLAADEFALLPKGYFDNLPKGIVNVALAEMGQDLLIGGDYGMGNVTPVEVVGIGEHQEVRIFRTPELPISNKRPASGRILVGNVGSLYLWIETPPVQGEWSLTIHRVNFDGTKDVIFQRQMKPGVRDFVGVSPHSVIEWRLSTKTTAIKFNRRFNLTLSPTMYAVWPDFLPEPHRSIFD